VRGNQSFDGECTKQFSVICYGQRRRSGGVIVNATVQTARRRDIDRTNTAGGNDDDEGASVALKRRREVSDRRTHRSPVKTYARDRYALLVKRGDEQKRLMPIALAPKRRLHRSLV